MSFEDSGKLNDITIKILKGQNIECSPFNILKYLAPLSVDPKKSISLRNSSFCLICDVISSIEGQDLAEISSLVYDLFSKFKADFGCSAFYSRFISALIHILVINKSYLGENSIFSE